MEFRGRSIRLTLFLMLILLGSVYKAFGKECSREKTMDLAREYSQKAKDISAISKASLMTTLLTQAESCNHEYHSVELRYLKKLAVRANKECAEETKSSISESIAYRDVKTEIDNYELCSLRLGKSKESVSEEVAKLRDEEARLHATRKANCTNASVNTTAMGLPRSQGNIGWCYAHTAADLMSHFFGKRVSAVDLAMNYNDSTFFRLRKKMLNYSEFSAEGGRVNESLEVTAAKGFCSDEDLRGEIDQKISNINLYREIERLKGQLSGSSPEGVQQNCLKAAYYANMLMPSVSLKHFTDIFTKTPSESLFSKLSEVACKKRITPSPGFAVHKLSGPDSIKKMDELLTQSWPVGIGFNMRAIDSDSSGGHANTVVGRRFNDSNGECQYRLRNTWGSNWGEGGYLWVSKQVLESDLWSITYVR